MLDEVLTKHVINITTYLLTEGVKGGFTELLQLPERLELKESLKLFLNPTASLTLSSSIARSLKQMRGIVTSNVMSETSNDVLKKAIVAEIALGGLLKLVVDEGNPQLISHLKSHLAGYLNKISKGDNLRTIRPFIRGNL